MNPHYVYDVELPRNIKPDRQYPVIFTLHGKGSNEKNMSGLTAPFAEDFIRIHIRGDLTLGAGYQYYELKSLGNPVRESFDRSVQQLQEFIRYASGKYPIDVNRRYLLGFSQGAILSMTLALLMGEQLKGIVALNGYVPEFVKSEYILAPGEQVSVFLSHGEFDHVFPVRIGHETADYFRSWTKELTFRLYPTDHTVSVKNVQDYVKWLQADLPIQTKE
ncbi:alpha/beta hydrolase [Paenibacillus pinihumi]|uniref:alpha/beta hydrolase n=1 Tax=Paenibacillus pinihumi TaxID=669462 RepID=UPI00040D00E2|nr:dienelactone hydrolase family protein [Paenibacillus pinihumi]